MIYQFKYDKNLKTKKNKLIYDSRTQVCMFDTKFNAIMWTFPKTKKIKKGL